MERAPRHTHGTASAATPVIPRYFLLEALTIRVVKTPTL
jgi:hypothetical protein